MHPNANPVRLIVSGTAGSGKTFLIMCLRKFCMDKFGGDSTRYVKVCAPTGTAAYNISGETLHRTLALPVPLTNELPDLKAEQLQVLQTRLEGLRLLIVDEMSMVGRRMLRAIDLRLRQAFPHQATETFGGISVCLLGDFGQLPPVMDRPMFDEREGGGQLSEDGRVSFHSFNKAVVLRRVERVHGNDPYKERFLKLLSKVRNGTISNNDYELMSSRLASRLSRTERKQFADSPRLVTSHVTEQEFNNSKLLELSCPRCTIKAVHQPAQAEKKKSTRR